jgi:hypothetical protein
MLDPKEKDYLEIKLTPGLRRVDPFNWFRLNMSNPEAFLKDFPTDLNTGELISQEAVRRSIDGGTKTQPVWAWLLDLVNAVTADGTIYDPILDPLRARVLSAQAAIQQPPGTAPGSFFLTFKLYADAPFLDRDACRTTLRSLHSRGGKTVMVINGPPKVGKTYSAELIDYVSGTDQTQPFKMIRFNLNGNVILDASDLEETITSQFRDVKRRRPEPVASHDAFLNSLGRWLCGCLEDSGKMWWLVFDSFNEKTVSDDAMKLARFLVPMPLQNPHRQYLRVVVIDSPKLADAAPSDHIYVANENLKIPNLEESHFRQYFESIHGNALDAATLERRYVAAWNSWNGCSGQSERLVRLPKILQEAMI